MRKKVKEVEKEAIQNAARNPTLSTRVVLAEAEDALARTKFQEEVVGKSTIHNPGRMNRISARY